MNSKQRGFAAVEAVLLVVIVVIIGFVGWYVYKTNKDNKAEAPPSTNTSQQSDDIPEVNNAGDLENAEGYLNSSNVDEQLDTSEIDTTISQ